MVLLPDTDARAAVKVIQRIRNMVAERCCGDVRVTASYGIATYHFPEAGIEAMVGEADRLMYRAKEEGRDRITVR